MNQLEAGDWSFLSSLASCRHLKRLYLDGNILQGILPSSVVGLSKSLEELFLAANKISGTIPQEIGHLSNLMLLRTEQNLLTGNLPSSLGNLQSLYLLSLSQNKLSGQIPLSVSNLSQLNELYLEENNLSGPIPGALGHCKNLETLNLSYNSFYGSIPIEIFTLSSLSIGLDLSHNQLSGKIPLEISGLINLGTLIISNNKLSGQIPSTLGECVHLESLHMEVNLLDGTIPESFANLRGIIIMDLSENNLSGEIPEFIENLNDIKLLNLSFNDLEGQVPTGGIFQNPSEVFIQVVLLKKGRNVKQAVHPSCKELKKFSYADLVKATNGFSLANLLGSGKYGSVYKGRFVLEEHTVAVKVFKLEQLGAPRSFLAECEALRNTRHRNLVRVISACSTFDPSGLQFKALEYMPNGSLESWLHPKLKYGLKSQLSLGSRITIAMDIASALDYLHNYCMPPMVHCDLKPSNVLLDDDMGARLADFGLAKFLYSLSNSCHDSSTGLLGPRGSIGYIAPGKPRNHATAGAKDCIMRLVKLGLSCSLKTPKGRPTMQEVYAEVITIKEAFAALCG
ncbi:putative LRR receptor-like serine/threonine-protein kinase [Dichanthelium oligosanthes]|uniref:Putative LRR receptor-like serine/threonine-protein kinase n=1 Tax=Dichanthelium oligosanthes TaxID=888268 RepID=A0A1E5VZH5_9POAL|nr:putative LRR receptor-like serine/threonine-protein kinase [Dichanthelium oligosanthes]